MATPRKSTARKAAPRAKESSFETFSRFRARAANLSFTFDNSEVIEPFVLGPDDGFAPPVVVQFPDDLENQYVLDRCLRNNDFFGALEVLMRGDLRRVLQAFSAAEDGHRLLAGLVYSIMDHFLGRGGADVPGGSQPS
ncbi:hypothetical protein [Rhodococcus zopfii]|uniref:hypothetical protein n=1 Tax=Rhodococcus zopfii TaxID=43772 RepID=UPI0009334604|nr:hypothetical protein [Rhodococcus zopfii]